jgi:eukaryotic-like serine/threonine-protein kinase
MNKENSDTFDKRKSRYRIAKIVAILIIVVVVAGYVGLFVLKPKESTPINSMSEKSSPSKLSKLLDKELGIVTNSIGMKLVWIPSGDFIMGSPSSEAERYSDEGPQHKVRLSKGFYMGIYEVTQAQYQSVMGNNPSTFKGENLPVENVSWNDAVEFCKKLSQKDGRIYRLPTEAQWEYACRAGTTTVYSWGNQWQLGLCNAENDVGTNEDGNVETFRKRGLPVDSTVPVGSFKPNSFGLYDMHGNVWEWCEDVWHDSYQGAPSDGSAWTTGGDTTSRVLRGGSWVYYPRSCRCASRSRDASDLRDYYVGFRVVVLDF